MLKNPFQDKEVIKESCLEIKKLVGSEFQHQIDNLLEKYNDLITEAESNKDYLDKGFIKQLNSINNVLNQHNNGFSILIKNQNDLNIKNDFIGGYLKDFEKSLIRLEGIISYGKQ